MKELIITFIAILFIALFAVGCTEQSVTKNYGGSMTVDLEPGQKLEEITWKDSELWILTRPMRDDEVPETHTFYEKSEFGVWEGSVTVKESLPVKKTSITEGGDQNEYSTPTG